MSEIDYYYAVGGLVIFVVGFLIGRRSKRAIRLGSVHRKLDKIVGIAERLEKKP